MLDQTARNTNELRLRTTVCNVYVLARVAGLRGVGGRNFDKCSARARELVSQKLCKSSPSDRTNTTSEPSADAHHVLRMQRLYDNDAVTIGIRRRETVQSMIALTSNLSTKAHDTHLRLFSIFRPFLSSRDNTLCMRKTTHGMFVEARILDNFAVTVCDDVHDATIDSDDGRGSWNGGWHLKLTHDAHEPLIAILAERACFWLTFNWPMYDDAHGAKFWEMEPLAAESPSLRMRLTERKLVTPLTLPTWSVCKFLEAALPRMVQLNEELIAHVARNLCKPRKLSSKIRQLVDLIERCRVSPFALRASVSKEPLLMCEVPQKTQSVLPSSHAQHLRRVRVDTETKCLANQHGGGA